MVVLMVILKMMCGCRSSNESGQQVKTAYDGFYLFSMIPLGSYTLRVEPDQVERLGLQPPLEIEIIFKGEDNVISGMDTTLVPLPRKD